MPLLLFDYIAIVCYALVWSYFFNSPNITINNQARIEQRCIMIKVQLSNGKQIKINSLTFSQALEFVRSLKNRRYDSAQKIWHVKMPESEFLSELENEKLYIEIIQFLESCNAAFQGIAYIAYPLKNQNYVYQYSDIYSLAEAVKLDSWEVVSQAIEENVTEYYYNRL